MSLLQRALLALFALVLVLFPLTRSAVAAPAVDAGAFAHCAAISGADERLACYDSLARARPSPPAAAATAPAPAKATPQSPPATHSAAATAGTAATGAAATGAAATGAAATGAAAAGAAAATAEPAAKSFGLTQHVASAEQGPDRIQAQAKTVDIDRLGTVRLSLDNGQVWTFNAPEALIRVGDTITIKRGALGSFLLTTPEHHTYKAQRSQ
jgi:hypothetical protein